MSLLLLLGGASGDADQSGPDTGAGVDDAALTVAIEGSETGSGVDAADLAVDLVGSDSGVGVDEGALDTGEGAETDSDSGSGADAATLEAALDATETGSGADAAASLEAGLTGAETGSGVDSGVQLDKTETGPASDVGVSSDAAHVTKTPTYGEPGEPFYFPDALIPEAAILYDGVNIIHDVLYGMSNFSAAANGSAGMATVRVKDPHHQYSFSAGRDLELVVDGLTLWRGYVMRIRHGYFVIDDKPAAERVRYFELQGIDVNVLFQRRYLFNKLAPTNMQLTRYPAGTHDDVIVKQYVADHLDLDGDGIGTDLVEHVGTPSTDTEISGAAGWNWYDFMALVVRNTGALFYLDPDKELVLTDVDTPNAPFGITDRLPGAGEVGCRELEIDFDGARLRNDALVWGLGQGSPTPVFKRTEDAASIVEHNRWQVGAVNPTVWRQATIDRISDSYVNGSPQSKRGGKDDGVAVRAVLFEPGLRVGMKINVRSDVFGYEDVLPVRSMYVDFVGKRPRFRIVASHEIDPPWSMFEFWMPDMPGFHFPDWNIAIPDWPPPYWPPLWPPFCPCCCAEVDSPPGGGLIAEWGANELGSWVIVDSGSFDPTAFSGSRIDNVVQLIGLNTLWYGGFAYLNGTFDTIHEFLLEFVIDPLAPSDNESSDNSFRIKIAATAAERASPSLGRFATFWWNRTGFAPASGYNFGEGNVAFTFTEGVRYSARIQLDDTTGAIQYKFWETSAGEPGSWTSSTAKGGTRTATIGLRLDPITWPTGTTPDPVNGISFWLGYGADAVGSSEEEGPCVSVGELMGLFASCKETFTRTESGGLGTSEINGYVWTPLSGTPTAWSVDGSKAVFVADNTSSVSMLLTLTDAVQPVEILLSFTNAWTRVGGNNGGVQFGGATVNWRKVAGGSPFQGASMRSQALNPAVEVSLGSAYHLRIRSTAGRVQVRAWNDGDPEPSSWQLDDAHAGNVLTPIQLNGIANVTNVSFTVDNIEVVEGLSCNPCGTEDEPEPDPPQGAVCEDLVHVEVDEDDHNHFRMTSQFEPRTTRVWVDGKLIRRTSDYLEHALLGKIEILDHIDVSGGVYACFQTAVIEALTKPEPI